MEVCINSSLDYSITEGASNLCYTAVINPNPLLIAVESRRNKPVVLIKSSTVECLLLP